MIKHKIIEVWHRVAEAGHKHVAGFDKTHHFVHLGYFGAVFIEGHGLYSGLGGILLVMGVVGLVIEHVGE